MKINTRPSPVPTEISPSIWWVGRGIWGGLDPLSSRLDANIYLLLGRDFDVLIDCGMGPSISKLERNLRKAGSHPSRIREIWVTHSHSDHFLGVSGWIKKYPRTTICISSLAIRFLKAGSHRLIGHEKPVGFKIPSRLRPLKDRSILKCAPFKFHAEALPGHTPDMMGFRGNVNGIDVLFSGDGIIGDQKGVKGGFGWLDGSWFSNVSIYEKTLKKVSKNPPQLFFPGHGVSHYGVSAKRSIRNTLRRIQMFAAIPNLGHIGPWFGMPVLPKNR